MAYENLKKREGFVPKAYWDTNGWAIGHGLHTVNGKPVQEGQTITKEQADSEFAKQIENNYKPNKIIRDWDKLSPNQQEALTSMSYNMGRGRFAATPLVTKLNSGQNLSPEDFNVVMTSNGKFNPVLAKRRHEEAQEFFGTNEPYKPYPDNTVNQNQFSPSPNGGIAYGEAPVSQAPIEPPAQSIPQWENTGGIENGFIAETPTENKILQRVADNQENPDKSLILQALSGLQGADGSLKTLGSFGGFHPDDVNAVADIVEKV